MNNEPGTPFVYPADEHNRELIEQVHPPDWTNPEPAPKYHLVVVGAGTAGLVSAAGAAGLGARVALVERHLMGGDCLNVGCVPSKGVIAASRVWHQVFDGDRFGAPPHVGSGEFPKAMERMRRIRAEISHHDSVRRFSDLGVDVFLGEGRFVSREAVEVGGATLRFRRAVIATGGRPTAPPIPGLDRIEYLTNETVFSLTQAPRRLAVIGAGPIGCELAQAFARLGSRVTLFDIMEQVLPREDADAASMVAGALERDGIELRLGADMKEVAIDGSEKVVSFTIDGEESETRVDEILVCTGRAPNTEGLGLEEAGVEFTKTGVKVDEKFRTTNSKVFACGDVASKYQFTHAADAQARAVLSHAFFFGFGGAKAGDLVIPWCTYTSPEVAHVGISAGEAEERGVAIDTIRVDLAEVDRARLDGHDEGFLEIHLAAGKDEILGATVVAQDAGELIAEIVLAMTRGIGLGEIADVIHPYPTRTEIVKKAADAWNRGRLTDRAKRFFRLWFKIFK